MPNKNVRKVRGPSRPIDSRYAPGAAAKKGPDKFGLTLVGISVAFVLVIILWAAAANSGNTATTTTTTSQTIDQSALATQQVAAQLTQVVSDATQTSTLARIEPKDALVEYNSGKAKFIDVRVVDSYTAGHIKGATSIPEASTITRLSEFPKLGELILYCQ